MGRGKPKTEYPDPVLRSIIMIQKQDYQENPRPETMKDLYDPETFRNDSRPGIRSPRCEGRRKESHRTKKEPRSRFFTIDLGTTNPCVGRER